MKGIKAEKPSCYGRKLGNEACYHTCPVSDECYKTDKTVLKPNNLTVLLILVVLFGASITAAMACETDLDDAVEVNWPESR